jgi:hypothetical protein
MTDRHQQCRRRATDRGDQARPRTAQPCRQPRRERRADEAAGTVRRLKRLTMIVDPSRTIRAVQFPVVDPAGSVAESLATVTRLSESAAPGTH